MYLGKQGNEYDKLRTCMLCPSLLEVLSVKGNGNEYGKLWITCMLCPSLLEVLSVKGNGNEYDMLRTCMLCPSLLEVLSV